MSDESPQPRIGESVPKPDVDHLTEKQKRAMEAGEEMEHEQGEAREDKEHEVEQLGDGDAGAD